MSKKSLLIVTMLMTMGATGRLWAQSQALTMSLEQLFQTADLHNTSIKSFDAAIREAEAGIKAAKAERLPDVDASVAFSYLGGGCIMDRDFSNDVGVHIPHYGNNFALTASMPIYAGGAITSGINLSRLAADMAKANASDNQQRVRMMLAGYYLFSHFLNDDIARYGSQLTLTQLDLSRFNIGQFMDQYFLHSMMSVALKQIYGLVIWFSGSIMLLFLLLDIPAVRTNVRKVPYWPVFGIEMLSRLRPLYMKRKTLNKVKKSRGKHRFLGNRWYLCGKFTKTARK